MQNAWLMSACAGAMILGLDAGNAAAQDTGAVAHPDPQTSASPQTSQNTLQEVIVTAEKRRQRQIDVPGSVSALTGASLVKQGITSVTDFAALTPGLTVSGGGSGATSLVLRGINTGVFNGPAVGVIVDGVPIGSASSISGGGAWTADINTWDLDRIEVLKGPQGTLYGAAGMTGLLSYVYNAPNLHRYEAAAHAEVSGTEDGAANYAVKGVVNIPLVDDRLALRIAASHESDSGYIDEPATNGKDVNHFREDSVRTTLLWQPTSRLSFKLEGDYQIFNRASYDYVTYNRSTGEPVAGSLTNIGGLREPWTQDLGEGALTIGYDLGWASLTSVTSYQTYGGSINALFTGTPTGVALQALGAADTLVNIKDKLDKWTQELRLTSKDNSPLHYLVGFFYTPESTNPDQILNGYSAAHTPLSLNPVITISEPINYNEYAGYAQVGYMFWGKLDLTGGFRVSYDTTSYSNTNGGLLGPTDPGVPLTSSSETEENYLFTARYALTPTSNLYARASSGYRPGGPNSGVPGAQKTFAPDKLWDYEFGYKADLLHRRAHVEADAFYITWSDIQVNAATAQGFSYTTNGRNAISQGVEAQGSVVPLPGLTLSGNVTYTDAHLSDAVPEVGGAAGEQLPNSPTWSGAVVADYRFPLTGTLAGFAGGTLRAMDDRFAAFDNDAALPQYKLPGYVLGDLRAGVDTGAWTVTAYVHNVGDKRAELSAVTDTLSATNYADVEIARPRTIGIMFDAHY